MSPGEALDVLGAAARHTKKTEAACDTLYALLRRDWAVRVLVELLAKDSISNSYFVNTMLLGSEQIILRAKLNQGYLSAEARDQLGGCP